VDLAGFFAREGGTESRGGNHSIQYRALDPGKAPNRFQRQRNAEPVPLSSARRKVSLRWVPINRAWNSSGNCARAPIPEGRKILLDGVFSAENKEGPDWSKTPGPGSGVMW